MLSREVVSGEFSSPGTNESIASRIIAGQSSRVFYHIKRL
jgi:hypothetical protein